MIISGAEPFFLKGGNHGVLLIHGFTGSPAEMLLIGNYLNSQGLTVLGIRLAGHGTNENDLSRTIKEDWLNSVIDGYSILKNCCDKISLVGHSMGALLALKIASIKSLKIFRLVTLAAPIFIDESLNLKLLPPREECINRFVRKRPRRLQNVPTAANLTYRLMPLISVHELVDIIKEVKKILPAVKSEILILHGKEDHTANVSSAEYIFKNIGSAQKEIKLIEDMGHLLQLKEGRELIFELTVNFLQKNEGVMN